VEWSHYNAFEVSRKGTTIWLNKIGEEMIRLKLKDLRSPAFNSGFGKLIHHAGYPYDIAANLATAAGLLQLEAQTYFDCEKKLQEDYALRDSSTHEILRPKGPDSFEIEKDLAPEYEAKLKELAEKEVAYDLPKVHVRHLSQIGLSPLEILAVSAFIDG
jgi:hypothetical protein